MVCTLLAGVNVVAFAADEATSVSISKFYNDAAKGGDGEHLFTKDADEISWLSSLPTWNNEGEAWKAPVSSNTTVFRCYNPASGEHLYVDEGYADYLAATGWNKEKLAFYSDDAKTVPVYRLWNGAEGVGSHHYTTDAGEVDWLVSQGWTKEDVAFYGVKEEANVVALTDINGFQADGTARKGDTLAVVFGSTFGTPASIAWYRDGAVVKVIPSQIDVNALTLNTGSLTEGGTGVYYAVVENTKGQSFTTNTVTVVDEGEAVISDFGISDNYEAVATWVADVQAAENPGDILTAIAKNPVACAADNDMAVIDVTVNKLYEDGALYIVDAEAETFAESAQGLTNTISVDPDDVTATAGNWTEVKADKFTNATLYSKEIAPGEGIYYTDKTTGATHFKFIATLPLTRGDDYVVVYADSTEISATDDVADYIVTDSLTAPYMMAPTSIVVTDRQGEIENGTTGWNAQLMMGEMPAAWVTDVNALAMDPADSYIEMYTNTSITTEGGTPFADQSAVIAAGSTYDTSALGGTVPTCGAAGQCVYAKFVGGEGIFGEDELELTSAPVEKALKPATSMTLDESDTNPYNATVSFVGLSSKASGTVYVLQGDKDNDTFDKIKKKDLTKAVAYAEVDGGATEVTIENVFKASDINKGAGDNDNNEMFVAVFVPDNTEFYTNMVAGDDDTHVFTLESQIVAYTLADNTMASVTGTSVVANKIKGLNQFLEEKDLTLTAAMALYGAIDASKWGPTDGPAVLTSTSVAIAGNGTLEVVSDGDGCLTLTVADGAASATPQFVKNTYADITLATGQKLRLICQNDVDTVSPATPVKFAVKIITE